MSSVVVLVWCLPTSIAYFPRRYTPAKRHVTCCQSIGVTRLPHQYCVFPHGIVYSRWAPRRLSSACRLRAPQILHSLPASWVNPKAQSLTRTPKSYPDFMFRLLLDAPDLTALTPKPQPQPLTWPLQDILSLRGCCARINHPCIPSPPALPTPLQNTRARLLRNIRRPPAPPFVCQYHTILATPISCQGQPLPRRIVQL